MPLAKASCLKGRAGGTKTTAANNPRTRTVSRSTQHERPLAKAELSPSITEDEQTSCMRTVNVSLQTLSAVAQSGSKSTSEKTRNTQHVDATKVEGAVGAAKKALESLRVFRPGNLDVERAACGITGKLITLKMYEDAVRLLEDIHPCLLRIGATAQLGGDDLSPLRLLSIPYPTTDDPAVLTLLITSVTHALNALIPLLLRNPPPFSADALVNALRCSHSLLDWAPRMRRDHIPEKTRDALFAKTYTSINNVCATLSSRNTDPESVFHLRMYAFSCLLYATPGTIQPTTFWGQVHKACLSYAQTLSSEPADKERESAFAACISRSLSEVVGLARGLCERSFLEARSFIQMCETWMSFAQKGDISILDDISALMGIPCSSSSSRSNSTSISLSSSCVIDRLADRMEGLKISQPIDAESTKPTHHSPKDMVLVECAQCCGIFVKTTAGLGSEGTELVRYAKEATEAVHRYYKLVSIFDSISLDSPQFLTTPSVPGSTSLSSMDEELVRARGKLERGLERLRRVGLQILDAPRVQSEDARHAVTSLLEAIATALEGSLVQSGTGIRQSTETRSTLTSLVDVFFSLARSRLKPTDVESYTPALNYLERAVTAVDLALEKSITTDDAATLLRCISGTLHNLGGTLYTAGRLGGAVRFLKEGCILGRRVLAMYASARIEDQTDCEKEGRQQLEEQLFRRYELLGVCHSKNGDRKLAYECFVNSVWTFPFTHHLATFSSAKPFGLDASLPLKQLSSIIERLTYVATFDLFLPPSQITLRHLTHVACSDTGVNIGQTLPPAISTIPSDDRFKAEIAGAILTHQLAALESIGHKDGARKAICRILEDLFSVYDASWAPVQRARVLVAALGVSWRDPDALTPSDVDRMGSEALELLARVAPESEDLASVVPQLLLSAHMWMALHAYRKSAAGAEMMHAVAMHIEAAYSVLCGDPLGLEGNAAQEANPNGKLAGCTNSAKGSKASNASKKGRPAVDGGKKVMVSTTKSQARRALRAVPLNAGKPKDCDVPVVKRPATLVDLQPILGLIQMNVHLLGLLGLIVLKVKLLEILKRVCECQVSNVAQAYSVICVDLAHEYMKLGKWKRANALFNKCANLLKADDIPDEARLLYFLGRAEVLALGGNVAASMSAYHDAQSLDAAIQEDKTLPTAKRIRARVERLERVALACRVFAAVQHAKDNVVGALSSMLQSLRLWNRAVDALARLAPQKLTEESANPFLVTTEANPGQPPPRSTPTPTDALSWRLLSHLVSTLFSLAHAYHVRGSPREALYFIQQVIDLAESACAPAVIARACILRGEVLLGQGALEEGRATLERVGDLLSGVFGIDAADAQRLRGDYTVMCAEGAEGVMQEGPKACYERAWEILDELERRIVSVDGGRRKSSLEPLPMGSVVTQGGQGMVVPRLLSAILRRHIWLLRNDGEDVVRDLVDRLVRLPPSAEIKGEGHAIMAKLALHRVYERFRSDMCLSSLTESVIALPMGTSVSGDKPPSRVPATRDILGALNEAEQLFWADLALTSRRGAVPHVREASVSLAMIRALQSSLGKVSKDGPLLAARLLDVSSAITLHREMLEAIPHKFADMNGDDLRWPVVMTDGSPVATSIQRDTSPFEGDTNDIRRAYWSALEQKYTSLVLSPTSLLATTPKLPHHWTVINITLTPDKSSMFISRLHTPSQPLLFCVPLRGRRDAEEEESRLVLQGALEELGEIVRLSDEGTRRAVHVKNDDPKARAGWWAERAALDKRLQALLENIEFCWLGAFKTILSPPTTLTCELIGDLRARLEEVFKRSLGPQDKKKKKVGLDDALVACFSALSPKCRDEELEDVAYFMLDLYQFHGVPVAISEVDMDQVTVDLRVVLEEHAAAKRKAGVTAIEDSHLFLVLDRSLQSIPWESLPVLRGQSVSRIPSLEFLMDRLRLAEMERGNGDGEIDRVQVNARKTYYVLNPSGDLKGTEKRFSSWLKEMGEKGWQGIIGHAPSEQELLNALVGKDLVIYFGHGGGEQYARSHKIRHLPRCAATMLWGCSSGALRDMGEFDRVGTPHHYMIAGCPTLVANLWDVTDRDIDKITEGVFDQLDLRATGQEGRGGGISVVRAVARAREMCKLKYLTGAAPVVYGVPFYL